MGGPGRKGSGPCGASVHENDAKPDQHKRQNEPPGDRIIKDQPAGGDTEKRGQKAETGH